MPLPYPLLSRVATLPLVIVLAGTLLSAGVAWRSAHDQQAEARAAFERAGVQLGQELQRRFAAARSMLRATEGLYVASEHIDRQEFRAFVRTLQLQEGFPGVRGLGFIERVERTREAAFLAAERADGAPDFALRELAPSPHPERYVIKFIEPVERNGPAVGLDVGSEPARREAIERAIDSGQVTLTRPVALVQDGRRSPGFLLYLPVYRAGAPLADAAARRAALRGVAYTPIVAAELLDGAGAALQLDFRLLAGAGTGDAGQGVVYASAADVAAPQTGGDPDALALEQALEIAGSPFALQLQAMPTFANRHAYATPWAVLGGGLLLTAFLGHLAYLTASGRRRAEVLAERMTADLDRLAMVARRTSDAVLILDTQRRITWVNESFVRITGFSAQEAQGQVPSRLLRTVTGEDGAIEGMRSAQAANQGFRGVFMNRRKDGREYWSAVEVQPLRDAAGALTGFMAVESDITERKQVELALARERERLAMIVQGTNAGTWEVNLQTGEDLINGTYAAMLGFGVDELAQRRGSDFLNLVHPEDRAAVVQARQGHLEGGTPQYEVEFRMRHRDGRWVWILSRGRVATRDAQGRPVWMTGIHLDISARHAMEDELRRSGEVMKSIVENLPCGGLYAVSCGTQQRHLTVPAALNG